jgi:hypothetical protein
MTRSGLARSGTNNLPPIEPQIARSCRSADTPRPVPRSISLLNGASIGPCENAVWMPSVTASTLWRRLVAVALGGFALPAPPCFGCRQRFQLAMSIQRWMTSNTLTR